MGNNSDSDSSPRSVDSEFSVPVMRTPEVKKALTANEKPWWSTQQRNLVTWFEYNEHMVHHYAFMLEVRDPATYAEAAQDPLLVDVTKEEIRL